MSFICLPKEQAESFKQALKDKDLNIGELLNMTTDDRTALLEKYVGDSAKDVNTLFEEKLVLKNRIQGIKNWASKVGGIGKFSEEGQAELEKTLSDYRAQQQQRIFSPKENEAFLNDIADKKLGVHITEEQASTVFDMASKLKDLKDQNPKMSGVSDEYLKAKNDLDQYIASIKPLSTGESIMKNLSIIGRNNLILNPATPLKTTFSQIVNSTMDAITRRLGSFTAKGEVSDLVSQANKEAWETFKKTGDNTAAMTSLDDTNVLGSRPGIGKSEDFKVPTGESAKGGIMGKIESVVRGTAKVSNKVAIDWEHSLSFTKFYQKTFFDAGGLFSTYIAKSEGLEGADLKGRAADIFKDAARIEPETREGAMVRMKSQEQAARVTSTNDTLVSEIGVGAKQVLNKIGNRIYKGFNIGDFVVPIAKIPANIIANGLDNAGAGLPAGIRDIFEGRSKIQSADIPTRYEGMVQYANGIQRLARITGTLTLSAVIASQLTKQDFNSDQYGNSYFKLGNVWINMEYLSAISPALAGFMYAKKDGDGTILGNATQFGKGLTSSLLNAPGIDAIPSLIKSATNGTMIKDATSFFTSRGVPSFLTNLTKSRPIERLFFGASGVETDAQARQDSSLSSWESANPGAELTQFKAKVGDATYQKANKDYNTQYSNWLASVQKVKAYNSLSDADQTKINTAKAATIKAAIFKKYGFTYKAVPTVKLPSF